MPAWLQSRYRTAARPVLKLCGWLMTNSRMFLLFFLFIVAAPAWFFWIELTAFNVLLAYVIFPQRKISKSMLQLLERPFPAQSRPHRNHGANRLFDQLCLLIIDRRLSTSANGADRAQPALLRPINRGLRF